MWPQWNCGPWQARRFESKWRQRRDHQALREIVLGLACSPSGTCQGLEIGPGRPAPRASTHVIAQLLDEVFAGQLNGHLAGGDPGTKFNHPRGIEFVHAPAPKDVALLYSSSPVAQRLGQVRQGAYDGARKGKKRSSRNRNIDSQGLAR